MLALTHSSNIWSVLLTILTILGSLGVFLFGMKVMSEGVQKVAGARMRKTLASITGNRWSGIFAGFATTSIIQSSSATTVLVVSFVNAGLLTLVESVGVIMGANLGTTVTAWIVALIGKFHLSAIALPIIGVGLPMIFVGKNRTKAWGEVLIGFGLLFFGLDLLKGSVPDVRTLMTTDPAAAQTIENIIHMLNGHGFGSIVLFLLAGIGLTLMVQSSSAAMAITITCALNGWFGNDPMQVFRISAAIVLGENIGTTVTAWLASLGANSNAKRAARAHFLFNVIGVGWMLLAFYPFTIGVWHLAGHLPESLRNASDKFAGSEIAFATAIFHTSFNLVNILLLVWFVPQIAKVAQWWIKEPESEAPAKLRYISQTLVDLGELNLAEAEAATVEMGALTSSMFDGFTDIIERPDEDLSTKINELKRQEDVCDEMLHDITAYLIHCTAQDTGRLNAEKITSMLRIVSEFEEATDRIYRLVKIVQRKYEKGRDFPTEQYREIRDISTEVRALLDVAMNSLHGVDEKTLETAQAIEDRIDALRKKNNKGAVRRMQADGTVQTEMLFTEINNHLEAIGNHALNIVQSAHSAPPASD
jgi:phosphate:Na+ symporter